MVNTFAKMRYIETYIWNPAEPTIGTLRALRELKARPIFKDRYGIFYTVKFLGLTLARVIDQGGKTTLLSHTELILLYRDRKSVPVSSTSKQNFKIDNC